MAQVAAIETALSRGLASCRDLPGVREVRVKGAIGVVELDRIKNLNALKRRFVDAGVWLRPFGNIIYLTPAFTISEQDLSLLTSTVVEVLRAERQD
jgi:adenosylmethionine-8-amino-7-oxononanoate aminotransferase